ncbi:hypothetical protein LTR78_006782 [Recurvomyces mirabilis]|uniref:Uncharacterized protein n=1 Tax=Recurvomyces mirabilis TaxID=574656 RepID=A0AAE1BZC1_9PEZI|nr:hypothetical protein LTR78_006782 [Recurvomyces mirabilis]
MAFSLTRTSADTNTGFEGRTLIHSIDNVASTPSPPVAGGLDPQWAGLAWTPPPQSGFQAQLQQKADIIVLLAKGKDTSINCARSIFKHITDITIDRIIDDPSKKPLRGRMYEYIVQIVEETQGSSYALLNKHRNDFEAVSLNIQDEIGPGAFESAYRPGTSFNDAIIGFPPPSVVATSRANEELNMSVNEEMTAQIEVWEAMARQICEG